jgi:hypothetical protein
MKIISKFKDYYDYLAGIYGVDEKLILDRTEYTPVSYVNDFYVVRLAICDYFIEGIFYKGEYLFGEEVKDLIEKHRKKGWHYYSGDNEHYVDNDLKICVLKEPKLLKESPPDL